MRKVTVEIKLNYCLINSGLIALFLLVMPFCKGQNNNVTVVTMAGTGEMGCDDGIGTKATFKYPQGVAVDDSGNVYVGDYGNHKIRKISFTGMVSTDAGNGYQAYKDGNSLEAGFYAPNCLAFDKKGNLYIDDLQKIRKLNVNGQVITIAGNGDQFPFSDGNGLSSSFSNSNGIAIDSNGNIYIADYGHNLIRKISIDGIVSSVGANPRDSIAPFSDSPYGENSPSHFSYPSGIALDSKGNIYVSEAYENRILKVSPDVIITTFAGNGNQDSTDGKGIQAGLNWPQGLAMDLYDNLYVADAGNNKIRMITPDGIVTTLAGNGEYASDDGDGSTASFRRPSAITLDKHGSVYVAELQSNKIRKITFNYKEYLKKRLEILKVNDHHKIIDTAPLVGQIDTSVYIGYPYWDSAMERFGPPYIDTFIEDGIQFRIVHIKNERRYINTATLERLANGKWIKKLEFEPLNHEGPFDRSRDINGDGFNDITHELRFTSEVYFFDPGKKDFIDSSTAEINNGIFLIDTVRNIYCDFQEYKGICGQISSSLYTFRGFRLYKLFELEFSNCDEGKEDSVTKLVLKKCINGSSESLQKVKETILKTPLDAYNVDETFDYKTYWEKTYKNLLGYQ